MSRKPLILDIKGNSLDDGPGIRTVVFMKGCPLSCTWCHNPESKSPDYEISFDANECIGCDTCLEVCNEGALSRSNSFYVNREKCTLCFACTETCPTGALSMVGKKMEVDEIIGQVVKDKLFFDNSGGGVTISGGEPTMFMPFLSGLLSGLKKQGVHTLIETCGLFNLETFMDLVYPHLDVIYFDIKIYDANDHLRFCGADNRIIFENFIFLYSRYKEGGVEILPRIPVIPGMTDTTDNMKAISSFLKELHVEKVELMPYHPLWQEKNLKIGVENPGVLDKAMSEWMNKDGLDECRSLFRNTSIEA
jgi:pyruvate formate lyase activating enzyme